MGLAGRGLAHWAECRAGCVSSPCCSYPYRYLIQWAAIESSCGLGMCGLLRSLSMVSFALFEQCRHAMTTTKQRTASTKKGPSTRAKRPSRQGAASTERPRGAGCAGRGVRSLSLGGPSYVPPARWVHLSCRSTPLRPELLRGLCAVNGRFETFEELAAGDVAGNRGGHQIGGLAKIKAPAIQAGAEPDKSSGAETWTSASCARCHWMRRRSG